MTTVVNNPQIVPRPPAAAPALRAADQGVASALTSVLPENTRRVYGAQWRLFHEWCDSVGLPSLPAQPLTDAHYLALAESVNCELWTADERFYRAASPTVDNVRWVGDFSAPE